MVHEVPYLERVRLLPERVPVPAEHPFDLACVRDLDLELPAAVTILVGENGSGKSTLLEALAVLLSVPTEGGSRQETARAERVGPGAALARALRPSFRRRPRDAWFFRAESLVRFADLLDERKVDPDFWGDPYASYGGRSLHERSHGEAFFEVLGGRLRAGLLLLDEPEAALSPQRQLALLVLLDQLARSGEAQVVMATHSPVLMSLPGAALLSLDAGAPRRIALPETSHYRVTRGVLEHPERWLRPLLDDPAAPAPSDAP